MGIILIGVSAIVIGLVVRVLLECSKTLDEVEQRSAKLKQNRQTRRGSRYKDHYLYNKTKIRVHNRVTDRAKYAHYFR